MRTDSCFLILHDFSCYFSDFDVPDRLTGLSGLQELKKLNCERTWNFVQVYASDS